MMNKGILNRVLHLFLSLFISALLFSCFIPVYSKPTWLKPGVYIEYKIVDAWAHPLAIAYTVDLLEPLGLLHRHRVGNFTVFSDLEPDEIRRIMEKWNLTEKIGRNAVILSMNFSSRMLELFESGKLSPNTRIPADISGVGYYFLNGIKIYNASYSWRVVGFKGSLAEVRVRFNGSIGEYVSEVEDIHLVNKSIDQTFIVLIDPDTREVFTEDGERLGVVPFWITDLIVGRNVTVLSLYNNTINGVVDGEFETETPLGVFKSYIITRTERTVTFPGMKAMCFDRVKGILLSTSFGYSDPILLRFMNVSFINIAGKSMKISRLENVEPPREIIPREQIHGLLGLAMLGAALLILLFVRFRRRRLMEAQANDQTGITIITLSIRYIISFFLFHYPFKKYEWGECSGKGRIRFRQPMLEPYRS